MKLVAVSQRVVEETRYSEVRDALDQRWVEFLQNCGLLVVPIPNNAEAARQLLATLAFSGVVLTGGGDHPKRKETEQLLLSEADKRALPVLGVCHGMQVMQRACGLELQPVKGHVAAEQDITIEGKPTTVNSYHDLGTTNSTDDLSVWAVADDGVVKAVRHRNKKWLGIMWHPERMTPFAERDITLFTRFFA